LETGAPELLGTPDFTEVRNVQRRFPKDAGERDCYRYLLGQMRAAPDRPHRTKAEFRLPTAFSRNGSQLRLLLARRH
jgi:hypothetical protein